MDIEKILEEHGINDSIRSMTGVPADTINMLADIGLLDEEFVRDSFEHRWSPYHGGPIFNTFIWAKKAHDIATEEYRRSFGVLGIERYLGWTISSVARMIENPFSGYKAMPFLEVAPSVISMLVEQGREDFIETWRDLSNNTRDVNSGFGDAYFKGSQNLIKVLLDNDRLGYLGAFAAFGWHNGSKKRYFRFGPEVLEHSLAAGRIDLFERWARLDMDPKTEYAKPKFDKDKPFYEDSAALFRELNTLGLLEKYMERFLGYAEGNVREGGYYHEVPMLVNSARRTVKILAEQDALQYLDVIIDTMDRIASADDITRATYYLAAVPRALELFSDRGDISKFEEWSRHVESRFQGHDVSYFGLSVSALREGVNLDNFEDLLRKHSFFFSRGSAIKNMAGIINSDMPFSRKLEHIETYQAFQLHFDYDSDFLADLADFLQDSTGHSLMNYFLMDMEQLRATSAFFRDGKEGFRFLDECLSLFARRGIFPASYLISELARDSNRCETVDKWATLLASFKDGNFDADNELHRNLEYTNFRAIVDQEKVRRHMKNHFSFSDYESIFKRRIGWWTTFADYDRFEIECVAYEATKLRDFIIEASRQAAKQGRKTVVVPNLSYGYLPVAPLVEELSAEGIEFVIGAKVGSTECGGFKEYVQSRLLEDFGIELMNEQPLIIVVDGTKRLVSRAGGQKAARYPDSHTGYLNQVIAMNDALDYVNMDYSAQGKTPEDMDKLRASPEFQGLIGVYKHVLKSDEWEKWRRRFGYGKRPYRFEFWNTAGHDLIIRNNRERVATIKPVNPRRIKDPAMVFCNVGLLDEQIPEHLREGHTRRYRHIPARFDDTERIIAFDFGYDDKGVRYLNRLETEVKKAYARQTGAPDSPPSRFLPEILRYIESHGNMPTVCGQSQFSS